MSHNDNYVNFDIKSSIECGSALDLSPLSLHHALQHLLQGEDGGISQSFATAG